jgi:hypothetical protein
LHAVYALYVVVPHERPSVICVHACDSPVSAALQVPVPVQVRSVRVRVCVPVVAHAVLPVQVLHAVKVVVPQPTPASTKPLLGHAALVPSQRSSASQVPLAVRHTRLGPSSPHVPSVVAPCATLHASHAPAHAVLQHTPSTQLPDWHSVAPPHTTPLTFFAEQYVPLQYVPVGQPLLQRMGQSTSEPLHVTAMPHAGEPGSPDGAGRHAPPWPIRLQRSQLPLHGPSQHTPSAQKPDWHWLDAVHATPCIRSASHRPLSQKRPAAHCRDVVHDVGQLPLTPSHA